MNKCNFLCVFLCLIWFAMGCAPTGTVTKSGPASAPSYAEAKTLYEGIEALANKLIASASEHQVGKIAVADLIGPSDMITGLGEHIADKVSLHLFSARAFPDIMERRQLKQVLLSLKKEHSGYFDQRSAKKFSFTSTKGCFSSPLKISFILNI